MIKLKEKIRKANFKRITRSFTIIAVLAAIIGGIAGFVTIQPQLNKILTLREDYRQAVRETGQMPMDGHDAEERYDRKDFHEEHSWYGKDKHEWEYDEDDWYPGNDGHYYIGDVDDYLESRITPLSTQSKVILGIIGAVFGVLYALYWLLITAWLYQVSDKAKMHGWFWALMGLFFNLMAVTAFLIVRQTTRTYCASCKTWQKKAAFCANCGVPMESFRKCQACRAEMGMDDKYCTSCGKALKETEMEEQKAGTENAV